MDNKYNINFDEAIKYGRNYVEILKERVNTLQYDHFILRDIQESMLRYLENGDYQNYFIELLYFNIYVLVKNNVVETRTTEVLDNYLDNLVEEKEQMLKTVEDYIDFYLKA